MAGAIGLMVSAATFLSGSVVFFVSLSGEGSTVLGVLLTYAGLFGLAASRWLVKESMRMQLEEVEEMWAERRKLRELDRS